MVVVVIRIVACFLATTIDVAAAAVVVVVLPPRRYILALLPVAENGPPDPRREVGVENHFSGGGAGKGGNGWEPRGGRQDGRAENR